jgi:hypothetical protein
MVLQALDPPTVSILVMIPGGEKARDVAAHSKIRSVDRSFFITYPQ